MPGWDFVYMQDDVDLHTLRITKTRLFKYIENFTTKKEKKYIRYFFIFLFKT